MNIEVINVILRLGRKQDKERTRHKNKNGVNRSKLRYLLLFRENFVPSLRVSDIIRFAHNKSAFNNYR
jgi:hypothetical protein